MPVIVRLTTGSVFSDTRTNPVNPPAVWQEAIPLSVPVERLVHVTPLPPAEGLEQPPCVVHIEGRGDIAVREPLAEIERVMAGVLAQDGVWAWNGAAWECVAAVGMSALGNALEGLRKAALAEMEAADSEE